MGYNNNITCADMNIYVIFHDLKCWKKFENVEGKVE